MIAYEGQHEILKMNGQLYWQDSHGAMKGIDNGYTLFNSTGLFGKNHSTRLSVRFGLKGMQQYNVGGTKLNVDKTQFLVMNNGVQYDIEALDNADTTMLVFCFNESFVSDFVHNLICNESELLDNFDLFNQEKKSIEFPLHTQLIDEHIRPLVRDVLHAKMFLESYEAEDYTIFSKILELLFLHNKEQTKAFRGQEIVKKSTKMELYRRLSIARDYIQTHFTEDVTLSEISRVACLSPYHFHRAFKNTFKITPKKFVTFLRIEKTKWLLQHNCSSIQMICNEVGFRDVSSFTRLFTQWAGMTPAAYRMYVNRQYAKTA